MKAYSSETPNGEESIVPSKFADAFEKQYGKFGDWIEKNNEAIFDAFVSRVVKILNNNPGMSWVEFFCSLMPRSAMLDRAMSPEEQHTMMQGLAELSSVVSREASRNEFFPESQNDTEVLFSGTGSAERSRDKTRKLYCNPDIRGLKEFIEVFYGLLAERKLSIFQSKAHLDGAIHGDAKEILQQGSNTFVIYCCSDDDVPRIVDVLADAEAISKIPIHGLEKGTRVKSPSFLEEEKILLGGADVSDDNERRSFDNWSNAVAQSVFNVFQKKGSITHDEARNAMEEELKYRTGRTPKKYLSL